MVEAQEGEEEGFVDERGHTVSVGFHTQPNGSVPPRWHVLAFVGGTVDVLVSLSGGAEEFALHTEAD